MNRLFTCFILIVTIASGSLLSYAQQVRTAITLEEYGLNEALSGEQVYRVMYKAHCAALKEGRWVDYAGIDTLRIEIPDNAISIPLTHTNDFKGVVINVTNKKKDLALFEYINVSYPITVSKESIDKGRFRKYPQIKKGRFLLSVQDKNSWVKNREGYGYGHYRKDILLVVNGRAKNKTVMPYNNDNSVPECNYYDVSKEGVLIENIKLNRSPECVFKTYLCTIEGVDGLELNNVAVCTPDNDGESDHIILLHNCTNVSFNNLTIDGTYSRKDYSGYGVEMDNIWNFYADKMYGHGNFGIFGNNNINKATLSNSDINRFDVHCYGRDLSFNNVVFRNKYNQFASVFGTIRFNNCSFIDFIPIINSYTYNAYVGYDLVFNDCDYTTNRETPIILDESYLDDFINCRPELSKRCIPNVYINNMTLNLPRKAPNVYLFFFRKRGGIRTVDYVSNISVKGLRIVYNGLPDTISSNFVISNIELDTENKVKLNHNNNIFLWGTKPSKRKNVKIISNLKHL